MISVFVFDQNAADLAQMKEAMQCEAWYETCTVMLYQSGRRMLEEIQDTAGQPAIAFLGLSSAADAVIELGKSIRHKNPLAQVGFVAENREQLLGVYEAEHVFLLLKPVKRAALRKAFLISARRIYQVSDPFFPVVTRKQTYQVRRKDILYLEKELRLIHVHTDSDVYTCYGKFEDIQGYLTPEFCRCHNSYIVNLDKVICMKERTFLLENGEALCISQKRHRQVKEYYLDYLNLKI